MPKRAKSGKANEEFPKTNASKMHCGNQYDGFPFRVSKTWWHLYIFSFKIKLASMSQGCCLTGAQQPGAPKFFAAAPKTLPVGLLTFWLLSFWAPEIFVRQQPWCPNKNEFKAHWILSLEESKIERVTRHLQRLLQLRSRKHRNFKNRGKKG